MARRNHSNGLLTARQVARLLNVHVNTVRRWNDRGILKAYRIGPRGDRRFNKADIDVFLAGNDQPENETAAELVLVS
jgi:excisionase family DNA binding protein